MERPREKLLTYGSSSLSDVELLAILLKNGIKGKTAVDLAHELFEYHDNLWTLLSLSQEDFCQVRGLGPVKYVELQAALEISKRYLATKLKKSSVLKNPQDTKLFLVSELGKYEREVFACLYLNTQFQIISFDKLFHGTLSHTQVHPREVVKQGLLHNAAAVILAHNHPSGKIEPSEADKQITEELKKSLSLVEIKLLDHIIVGDQQTFSFVEWGLL